MDSLGARPVPDEPETLFDRRGAAGIVTLNRPQALNAVTHGMVRALRAKLDAWQDDPSVTRVVVVAAGERAFSAGGGPPPPPPPRRPRPPPGRAPFLAPPNTPHPPRQPTPHPSLPPFP